MCTDEHTPPSLGDLIVEQTTDAIIYADRKGMNKSGQGLYVEMSFSVIAGATGEAIGSVAIARDATARILAEKAAAKH